VLVCYSSRFPRLPDTTARTGQTHSRTVTQPALIAFAVHGHFIKIGGRYVKVSGLVRGKKTGRSIDRHEGTGEFEKDAFKHGLSPE
jgi:hypothetical protein